MFENTIAFMEGFLADGIPGCDLIVCQNGKQVLRKWMGYSDREQKIPMNGKERYYIYSCSKVITCTAALQLRDKGLFKLDDPLYLYLPEFKNMKVRTGDTIIPAKSTITIRNLFTMTAGFNYDTWSPSLRACFDATNGACSTREAIRYLAQEPLIFEPGTRWEYSLCHDVLAALVEVVSGMPFNNYLTVNIFRPLGMNRTTFLLKATDPDQICPLYTGLPDQISIQRNTGRAVHLNSYRLGHAYASGGAGCVSTVEDYSRFLEALRQGDVILSKETIREMSTPQLTEEQNATYWDKGIYGYGLGVRAPNPKVSGRTDFGWGGAAGSYLAIDLPNQITFFYAQHVLSSPVQARRKELTQMILKDLTL